MFGWLIKYGSQSDFSHIGMVVVNPDFTHLDKPLKGVYVWQSGTAQIPDAEDGKRKIGVQLTPIVDFITTYKGKIYLRRLHVHTAEDCIENNTTMVTIDTGNTALVTRNRNVLIKTFSNTFSTTFGYIYSGFSILKYFFIKVTNPNPNPLISNQIKIRLIHINTDTDTYTTIQKIHSHMKK